MSVRARGRGHYQVRVSPFPAVTLPTMAAARAVELDLKLRKGLGDLYSEPPSTLADELDGFEERKNATGKLAENTVTFNHRSSVFWRDTFGHRLLSSLRRAEVEDAITTRAAAHPRSAANELQHLKAVLVQAEQRGQRFDRAILTIPPVGYEEREGIALSYEQLEELASWAPEYVRRLILFAGTSALRASELFTLTDDRVDLDAGTVTIPRGLNKSRRLKVIDLCSAEARLLTGQLLVRAHGTRLMFPKRQGSMWRHQHFRKVWLRATLAAGLGRMVEQPDGRLSYEGLRVHDLRHTASSLMCLAGMRPELVAERRGDADGGMLVLKRYRHLYPGEGRAAVGALDVLLAREDQKEAKEA